MRLPMHLLGARFVGSRHPAVLRGHATAEEVRQELLDTFFSAGATETTAREEVPNAPTGLSNTLHHSLLAARQQLSDTSSIKRQTFRTELFCRELHTSVCVVSTDTIELFAVRKHHSIETWRPPLLPLGLPSNRSCLHACLARQQASEKDFIEHHANLSFGIKRDEDFRELVINCWGLDGGGVGGGHVRMPADVADVLRRVNAPRRKFLVSYADGSQRVEELPFSSKVTSLAGFLRRVSGHDISIFTPSPNKLKAIAVYVDTCMHISFYWHPWPVSVRSPAKLQWDLHICVVN